jgi:hypothetical protein
LHLDDNRLADLLPVQRFLDHREDVVVSAVQIDQRLLPGIDEFAVGSVTL